MSEQQGPPGPKIDVKRAADWLNTKWQGPKVCPICKNNNWGIPDTLAEVRGFFQGSLVVGGPVFPVLLVTCNVCGHVLAFNAVVMGLVERTEAADKVKAAEK